MKKRQFLWAEVYRPSKVEECILPERFKALFQKYVDEKSIPNLMLCGTTGVGKTTIAMAMCEEAGIDYLFLNSSKERGIDTLRTKITQYASSMSLLGGRKVIILDEADGLTPEAQNALRGSIEEYSNNCTFILTCNFKAKLIEALHSRTSVIDFQLRGDEKVQMAGQFFVKLQEILTNEQVDYDKATLINIVKRYFPDFRRILGETQRLSNQFGKIDAAVLGAVSEIRNVSELMKHLKAKDFANMRKWVVDNGDSDPSRIYRKIYDALYTYLEPSSIPQAVLIIARYSYQAAFAADQEVQLVACLTEMMVDCTYQ